MSDQNQFLLYTAPNGAVKVDVVLKDETVWLTQKALAELLGAIPFCVVRSGGLSCVFRGFEFEFGNHVHGGGAPFPRRKAT